MNEPQNWLLMNGDYGNTRYSKLAQINRDNVKNLRMVWAMALGGMQDVGQNGPENEVNPLIDNGMMYTTDGWGTVYKIDATRAGPGQVRVDGGRRACGTQGNAPRTRGIALWEDRVFANLPDGRVIAINRDNGEIVWDKRVAGKNEFGGQEEFYHGADRRGRQRARAERRRRRRHARLDRRPRREDRRREVALLHRAEAGRSGQRDLEGRSQRLEDRRRRHLADGRVRSGDAAVHRRHRQSVSDLRPAVPSGRQPVHRTRRSPSTCDTGKLAWHFQYTPNDSWDFDEVGVHMLYDIKIDGVLRKVVGHYARNGFYYTLDRTNGKFIRSEKYVNDLNWTKGIDQKTGKPFEYNPKLDVQLYNPEARALRGDGQKRTCPTWHGGVAHQPLSFNPVKKIAYGVGTEGCFSQNGAAVASLGPDGGVDNKTSEPRKYSSDLYYGAVTAFDAANHKVLAKVVTDIEIRSGVIDTAGGVLFTRAAGRLDRGL